MPKSCRSFIMMITNLHFEKLNAHYFQQGLLRDISLRNNSKPSLTLTNVVQQAYSIAIKIRPESGIRNFFCINKKLIYFCSPFGNIKLKFNLLKIYQDEKNISTIDQKKEKQTWVY